MSSLEALFSKLWGACLVGAGLLLALIVACLSRLETPYSAHE